MNKKFYDSITSTNENFRDWKNKREHLVVHINIISKIIGKIPLNRNFGWMFFRGHFIEDSFVKNQTRELCFSD